MPLTATRRRFTTWLALWLVVWGALLPTLSQAALRLHDGADRIEVCTSTGMVWIQLDAAPSATPDDDAPDTATVGMTCPWCLSPHHSPALPPSSPAHVFAPVVFNDHPPSYWQAAHTDHVWRSASARAPPLLT